MQYDKIIMIYDDTLEGHHLEYLHHIHNAASSLSYKFVFVLPIQFEEKKKLLKWPDKRNIFFDLFSNEESQKIHKSGYFTSAWNRSKVIGKYAKKYHVDDIFLITLVHPYPFLPLFLPSYSKVSGIIYRIHFFELKSEGFVSRIKDQIENWIIANSSCTKHPMILNSPKSTKQYNSHFRVDKYLNIADPIKLLPVHEKISINYLGLQNNDILYLHFGALNKRKGTLQILEAINLMTKAQLVNRAFIFAGKVSHDINEEFYVLIDEARLHGAKIFVKDEFCSYEMLGELCSISDYYLIPYSNVNYSSGVVGHAAEFGKRLIGPSEAVLGELIRQIAGSILLKNLSSQSIYDAIVNSDKYIGKKNTEYIKQNSITTFQQQIMEVLAEKNNV